MVLVLRIQLLISSWQYSRTSHQNSLRTASQLVLSTMLHICHFLLKSLLIQLLKALSQPVSGVWVLMVLLVPIRTLLRLSVTILTCMHRHISHMILRNQAVLRFPICVSAKIRSVRPTWLTRLTSSPAIISHMLIIMTCFQHSSLAASSF